MIDDFDEEDDERGFDDRVGAEDLDDGPHACIGADCCNPHVFHRRDECAYASAISAVKHEAGESDHGDDV